MLGFLATASAPVTIGAGSNWRGRPKAVTRSTAYGRSWPNSTLIARVIAWLIASVIAPVIAPVIAFESAKLPTHRHLTYLARSRGTATSIEIESSISMEIAASEAH
ncbi:hypothetical protein [Saccharopolyspora sp. ASAGF58]|uniref:hypothetical protein n=1 Tax=Saccharopolyspora sp. ASAGF58 TaxID=2719023 RepID=UPI00143FF480|nr:hypothetical protein [Saccharopolyspora sp. ASAGF58]QIZ35259.1 hypothetical protein FDZ84_11775 [Saccharopolyspora sp. ASAGF58]